jgi:hypothetical protein
MRKRNLIGAAAFSVALAGGGVAGAMLGTPGVSGAQDGTTSTTAPATTDAARPRPPHPGARVELKAAADALGITPAELLTELKAGKSIADVASEKNVDLTKVTDAMVADGTAKLEAAIKALPDRVDAAVQRKGLPEHPDGPGPGGRGPRPADDDADDATTSTTTAS